VLKAKLQKQNLDFEVVDNIDEMIKMGIKTAPMLKVGDELLDFSAAVKYLKTLEANNEN
jgi:hypothetical protein